MHNPYISLLNHPHTIPTRPGHLGTSANDVLTGLEDKWLFHATTYDGSILKLYLNYSNNINDIIINTSIGSIDIHNSDVGLGIGSDSIGSYNFSGSIDDVVLFDRALSASEIKAVMNGTCDYSSPANAFEAIEFQGIGKPGVNKDNIDARNLIKTTRFTIYKNKTVPLYLYIWEE